MKHESGFGIITVMIGAVMLGIFALVFVQRMQNRTKLSLIADVMAFRNQVITYYSNLVSSRAAWECTVYSTSNITLNTYLKNATGGGSETDLAVHDGDADCQEGFRGTVDGTQRIPLNGLGLNLQDYNALPVDATATSRECVSGAVGHQFCLRATWRGLDSVHGQNRRAIEVALRVSVNRLAAKNQLGVGIELADREHFFYINRTVGTDCSDSRVTGHFTGRSASSYHMSGRGVNAYMGDSAVGGFDPLTGLVVCSVRGPLVIPPCYDLSDQQDPRCGLSSHLQEGNIFLSESGGLIVHESNDRPLVITCTHTSYGFGNIVEDLSLTCDGRGGALPVVQEGLCPQTYGGGMTAIAFFHKETGVSHCSHPNILVEKVDQTDFAKHCDGNDQFGLVQIHASGVGIGTFRCSTDVWGATKGGVEPVTSSSYPCVSDEAVTGFTDTGEVHGCVKKYQGPRGFQGAPGMPGASQTCRAGEVACSCTTSHYTCP